jgi:hypothetical protein
MQNKKSYPDNWSDEIRPRILTRDKYKCTSCGVKHRQNQLREHNGTWINIDADEVEEAKSCGFKTRKIFLQVAHINNIKSDCSDENLVTKCPWCHHVMDKRHKILMRIANLVKPGNS